MSFSRLTVSRIINVVKSDKIAYERIDSMLQYIPPLWIPGLRDKRGWVRNYGMATAETYLDIGAWFAGKKFGVSFGKHWNPFDPNLPGSVGYEYQCTGMAEAASAAIMAAKSQLPAVKFAEPRDRSEGLTHSGVWIETVDGGEYIVDWWTTLDIDNPYVFRYADWDQNQKSKGFEFKEFRGFH